jgi:ribose transport system permease protein
VGRGLGRAGAAALCLAALVGVFAALLPETFLTARNLLNVSQQVSILAVVAAGMTVVMASGDFDLSVGSTASLAGVVAASLFAAGQPVAVGVAAGLGVGLVAGLTNGALVAWLGMLPFVATLGTLTIYGGLAFVVSDGKTIFGAAIPEAFGAFARGGVPLGFGGERPVLLPSLTLVALAALGLAWTLLERRPAGRRLYAIGSIPEAAAQAGVRVAGLRALAFALAGLAAALAGLMLASRVASANPTQGAGLMLTAIAAVFLGMAMTRDGRPRVAATAAAVFALGLLDNGLTQLRVDSYVREVLVGAIILAAVGAGLVRGRRPG